MLILNGADVRAALPMADAIRAVRWGYEAWSSGLAVMPLRLHIDLPEASGVSIVMPAYVPAQPGGSVPAGLVVKAVSVFPVNSALGVPVVQGAVLALDPETGAVLALLDGAALTAIRTGAGSGVATELLARRDASTLAIIGTGAQALTQAEGVCTVRAIDTVWVCGRDRSRAERFVQKVAALPGAPSDLRITLVAREALKRADIVCTATGSMEALFEDDAVRPGTHINAVGAFRPAIREIPAATVRRSRLYVDSRASALKEAGDILRAIAEGVIDATHILGEIGEVCAGRIQGRLSEDDVTVVKSVGIAAQDAAAAAVSLAGAEWAKIGLRAAW